jgi:hypothetical protein
MIQKPEERDLQNKSCSINGSIDCGEKSDKAKKDYRFGDDKMPLINSATFSRALHKRI